MAPLYHRGIGCRKGVRVTYGMIGVGSIAAAIVTGLCAEGGTAPGIILSPRNAGVARGLAERFAGVEVGASNQAVIDGASVVILCVRPQDAAGVLEGLRFAEGQTVISVMAGVSLDVLARLVAPARDIARALPLPSVAWRGGVTPVLPASDAVRALFDPLGGTIALADGNAFEAISAATATVAAHFAYLDRISRFLAGKGISQTEARGYVASVFAALAVDLRDEAPDFEHLAQAHATRGGINEQFAGLLTQAGVFDAVEQSLERVLARLLSR